MWLLEWELMPLAIPPFHLKVQCEISDSERDFGTEPIQERSSFPTVYNWWFYLQAKSPDRQAEVWPVYSVGLKSHSVKILIVSPSHPLPFCIYHQSKSLYIFIFVLIDFSVYVSFSAFVICQFDLIEFLPSKNSSPFLANW